MSKTTYAALFILFCVVLTSSSSAQADKSESDKWREDLAVMAREMEATHNNLFHKMTRQQFEAAVKDLDRRIPQLQRHQIIVEMMKIVAMVGDGHTNIYPTRDQKIGFHTLPVQLYLFSDGLFIRSARKEQASLVSARVVKIGSVSADEAIARVSPLIGRDTEMGVKFFAPALLAMPEILNAIGLTRTIDSAEFTIEKAGKTETVNLKPYALVEMQPADTDMSWMPREDWVDMRDASSSPAPLWLRDAKNLFWYEYLPDSKTVYAQINQVGNKQNESLGDFGEQLTAFVESKQAEKLVIDMRLNRGGNGTLLKPLEIALLKSKIDHPGKLFILMGRSTWSASQFFLDWMEKYSNAIFVGEPSASRGNAYGDSRKVTLPNSGVTARVSVYYWQDWEPWDTRLWTAPQITAELSSSDYRSNVDPALLAALRYTPRKSLAVLLDEALTSGGVELAVKRFREFKAEPQNKYADTEQALLDAGQRLLNEKKTADALEIFKLDIAENAHSYRAYFAAGVAFAETGKRDLALTNLRKAHDLNPKSYDVTSYLHEIEGQQKP